MNQFCLRYIILFIIYSGVLNAQSNWEKEVNLNITNGSLKQALMEISVQSDIDFIFNDIIARENTISVDTRATVRNALSFILKQCNLEYKRFGSNIAVIFKGKKSQKIIEKPEQRIVKNIYSSIDTEITKPVLLSNVDLYYPAEAVKEYIEGEVLAKFQISKEGIVNHVMLEKASGHRILDTATLNYVKKLRYQPAEYNGKPHEVWTTLMVKYDLE
jgi:TonB family protein